MSTVTENTNTEQNEPVGVGGWLLLLIVKLGYGACLRVVGGFSQVSAAMGMTNRSGGVVAVAMTLAVGSISFGLLDGVAAFLLKAENPKGLLFAKIALMLDVVYYLLALGGTLTGIASLCDSSPRWFRPIGFLVASLIWLAYLKRSRRVANTFFKPLPA